MNKKSKFLAVLLLVVFALSMVVFGVACKKDKGDTGSTGTQSESKTATYYTDTVDGEYVVELFGNDCLLKIGSETMLGKFTLNSFRRHDNGRRNRLYLRRQTIPYA